jgi:MFS family permease
VVTVALAAMAAGSAVTIAMSALWQLTLLWGVVIGAATGCLSSPLAAIVATRWFVERRGLVTGLLSAAYATGQLIFLPFLALLVRDAGWRWASAAVALSAAAVAPLAFWLLAGTFFICGATTVGLIATHLIPAAHDHGIGEVQAAGLLAVIGVFDIIGVTASGWLTDRWDARQLLFAFYALRGLSLFFLPFVIGSSDAGLIAFVVVFGLDWVATVPPTVALTVEEFGRERAGVVFGWIFAAHQLGAAAAAWAAGAVRNASESYEVAFMGAGLLGVAAAFLALGIASRGRPRPAAAMPM